MVKYIFLKTNQMAVKDTHEQWGGWEREFTTQSQNFD